LKEMEQLIAHSIKTEEASINEGLD